jgi:hypothetical protein
LFLLKINTQLIQTQEHTELIQTQGQAKFCFLPEFETKGITYKPKGEVFGGLYFDFKEEQKQLKTSYFIGACWGRINCVCSWVLINFLNISPFVKHYET